LAAFSEVTADGASAIPELSEFVLVQEIATEPKIKEAIILIFIKSSFC
jgi:hypothetical protein